MKGDGGDEGGGGEGEGRVRGLIRRATNSTAAEVDLQLMKAIKSVVRNSDSEVRIAHQTLMLSMKTNHSQVRYLTLLIVDELFMRSKLFRSLLVVNFDQFLSLSIGFRRNLPLPAPPTIASRLRLKAIEFLEKWNISYGVHYRQIRLGFDYLKNTLRFQFPNIQQNTARLHHERREREIRSKEILLNKFENLRTNLLSIKNEIQITVDEIGECLDILHPKDDGFTPYDSEDEVEEYKSSTLQQIRLESMKEGEKVHENNDNKVIFDALRELYKLLVTKHLVTVQEWISVLVKVEPADIRLRDSMLKEFIDVRNHLQSVKTMCEQSGCTLTDTINDDTADLWEEGKVEATYNGYTSDLNMPSEGLATTTLDKEKRKTSAKVTVSTCSSDTLNGTSDESDSNPQRKKLLAEAPVMTWGSFLDNWGIDRDFLANHRGLELEGHWGRVDYDAVIPAEKIAELNVQATLYKEDHVEIKPCLAPLDKGGLCQRRDLKVCPFHGPIISRDAEGNPIIQAPSRDDRSIDQVDNKVVSQLAKQAINNVREKDREEAKKRQNDRHLLKRAKLAKVREHNDAVLRQAAVASTSYSEAFTEDVADVSRSKRHKKEKEQTLASMLRTKKSAKDRLADRLLNTRVTDATMRQLSMGEDAKYREAYPNQW